MRSDDSEKQTITSKDVGVLRIDRAKPPERELKMQRKVGDAIETHGVMEGEWQMNGDALKQDGWSLVSE